jgi:protein involved in polysaccharide export with SLBB domain
MAVQRINGREEKTERGIWLDFPARLGRTGGQGGAQLIFPPMKTKMIGFGLMLVAAKSWAATDAPVALPAVTTENAKATLGVYRLRPGDALAITVWGEAALGTKGVRIDAKGEGRIAGVAEGIPLAGLSVAEAQTRVEREYRQRGLTAEPHVAIAIESYATRAKAFQAPSNRAGAP